MREWREPSILFIDFITLTNNHINQYSNTPSLLSTLHIEELVSIVSISEHDLLLLQLEQSSKGYVLHVSLQLVRYR